MPKDYGQWSIKLLKDELRKRNAKTFGRKSELVSRLQDYDDNFNFRPTLDPSGQTSSSKDMDLPDVTEFKDINTSSVLPLITKQAVDCYLSLSGVNNQLKGANLYKEKYLLCVRSIAVNNEYFVKARCGAEMKKHVVYTVDLKISSDGAIEEAQCECGAGMGPTAHCKHVIALLFALMDFSQGKDLTLNESCTSRLQTFHQVKKYKGSPIKAHNLVLRDTVNAPMASLPTREPRPEVYRNKPNYQLEFDNKCKKISAKTHSRMPVLHYLPPANLFAYHNDHNYTSSTPEQDCLRKLNVQDVTEDIRVTTEKKTRGQSENPEWMLERTVRICSSSFGRICKATDRTNFHALAIMLATPGEQIFSDPINHGRKHENTAAKVYTEFTGNTVEECGLFISSTHPFLASSPDRVIDDTCLLEIKCPWVARHKFINPETVEYLYLGEEDGLYHLDSSHIYYFQIQGQLFCTNRTECHLMIWSFKDFAVINIKRNDDFINNMVLKLATFYEQYFKQVLVNKYLYLNYGKYF